MEALRANGANSIVHNVMRLPRKSRGCHQGSSLGHPHCVRADFAKDCDFESRTWKLRSLLLDITQVKVTQQPLCQPAHNPPFDSSAPVANMSSSEATTKQFGKGERSVPAASSRAKRWYPAEDTKAPRKVSKSWLKDGRAIMATIEFTDTNAGILNRRERRCILPSTEPLSNLAPSSSSLLVALEASVSSFLSTWRKARCLWPVPSRSTECLCDE